MRVGRTIILSQTILEFTKKSENRFISEKPKVSSMSKVFRQGDVIFVRVDSIPKGLPKKKDKIIARGGFTGHMHQFLADAPVEVYESSDGMYIDVLEPATIQHEEHAAFELEQGKYHVLIQRELNLLDEERKVMD